MFFLKELPTQAMLEKYTSHLSNGEVTTIAGALNMMRKASLLVRELEVYFLSHGLSQLRFLILIVIDREPDRESLYVHEIASRLDVSRPVLTRTLRKLIDDDLLISTDNKEDKRSKEIALTQKGSERLSQLLPDYFDKINDLMNRDMKDIQ